MYQTYKPSGKTEGRFFLFIIICMAAVVPVFSIIYAVLVWLMPSTLADIIVYGICFVLLCAATSRYCIRLGKVRNKKLAAIAAIAIFLWFSGLSLLFFSALYQGVRAQSAAEIWGALSQNLSLSHIGALVQNPEALAETLSRLAGQGYYFETIKAGPSGLLYRGAVMVVFWAIKCIASISYIIYYFVDDSARPFCESSKKWAAEYELLLEPIGETEEFKKQLYFGNSEALKQAACLRTVNSNHWEATLFVTEGSSNFYLTLVSKTRKSGPEKTGAVKFNEEDVVELLSVDRETGKALLNRWRTQDTTAGARVVNSAARLQSRKNFVKTLLFSLAQIAILVTIIANGEAARAAFSNAGMLFYLALNTAVWAFNLWGSFIEENVIEDEMDMLDGRGVSRHEIQKKSSPMYQKLFYFGMLAVSLGLLIYCIKEFI